jgi:hypothetical protein
VLARSMKEWDRRPGERQGFQNTAGDCLAFKYMRDVRGRGGKGGLGRPASFGSAVGSQQAARAVRRDGARPCSGTHPLPSCSSLPPPRRQAIECRFAEEAYKKLDQAGAVAETDSARERLAAARAAIEEAEAARTGGGTGALTSGVMLTLLRLSPDELGVRCGQRGESASGAGRRGPWGCRAEAGRQLAWGATPCPCPYPRCAPDPSSLIPLTRVPRPLPQLSNFGTATLEELQVAPTATQEGAFGTFTITSGAAGAHRWVALPQWKALSLARRPAALPIPDCAADAAISAASQAKTEDDRRRMVGPGLLVVDAHVEGEVDPKSYYLMSPPGGAGPLQLVDGKAAAARGGPPAAAVLFLARPPARDGPAAATSELLQV